MEDGRTGGNPFRFKKLIKNMSSSVVGDDISRLDGHRSLEEGLHLTVEGTFQAGTTGVREHVNKSEG
jgi:hypothetical protein